MKPARRLAGDAELAATAALLAAIALVGLKTAGDYGISVDEFNTDDYGPKALAWYTSGFVDRSQFTTVEFSLWYYGPWFQMLTAVVQSFGLADRFVVRHALTFLVGLAGLAAVLPIGRLAVGRRAGFLAIVLCLATGYLYGNLFFATIDVPFLAAMTWATLAVLAMARRPVPSWPASLACGAATGLAIATRTGGIITHAYLIGATALCMLEVVVRAGRAARPTLIAIGLRAAAAIAVAWLVAIALWPWLQLGNPFRQFAIALTYFATIPVDFEFKSWGRTLLTNDLPRSYLPEQLAARLPALFLALVAIAAGFGLCGAAGFLRRMLAGWRRGGTALRAPLLRLARARALLVVIAAALLPLGFLIVQRATLYDGVRHVLFVIPMLALIAAAGLIALSPCLRRAPVLAAAAGGTYAASAALALVELHPLEYVEMSALAGGTAGAYGRFDLDYWSIAAAEAVRRLEHRRRYENAPADRVPRIMVCIAWREYLVGPMLRRRPWIIVGDQHAADYVIATERWRCADDPGLKLIDEVKRADRTFAWIYARRSAPSGSSPGARR